LHGTSSGKGTRKFHFWRLLMGGGITQVLHILGDTAVQPHQLNADARPAGRDLIYPPRQDGLFSAK
nr:hypothetical protein [Xanthomonas phaseoli pv. phaseoli]